MKGKVCSNVQVIIAYYDKKSHGGGLGFTSRKGHLLADTTIHTIGIIIDGSKYDMNRELI